jgi:3-dehydroquinate dehydratase-2
MTVRVLVIHGPNLNLLGRRRPEIYGRATLAEIDDRLRAAAADLDAEVTTFQSNDEGALIDRIQAAMDDGTDGILINPAAYTHTSVAIRDALEAAEIPTVEVHLSNPDAREEFRRKSLVADVVAGRVAGFGPSSYELGLQGLCTILQRES